jgi:hypothetical protein
LRRSAEREEKMISNIGFNAQKVGFQKYFIMPSTKFQETTDKSIIKETHSQMAQISKSGQVKLLIDNNNNVHIHTNWDAGFVVGCRLQVNSATKDEKAQHQLFQNTIKNFYNYTPTKEYNEKTGEITSLE